MTGHYFDESPRSENEERLITAHIGGRELVFMTNSGVFSKQRLDRGSELLIQAIPGLSGAVADMGCGWGAIGISLAALNPDASFILTDINERAVELAAANILKNGIKNAAALKCDGLAAVEGGLSAVVTNPPIRIGKEAMYGLFRQAHCKLADGGAFFAVIRKQQGAESSRDFLRQLFGNCSIIKKSAGYHILQSLK